MDSDIKFGSIGFLEHTYSNKDKYLHKKNHQMENGNLAVLYLHWNLTWKQEEQDL